MFYKRKERNKIRAGKVVQWLVFAAVLAYLVITLIGQQSMLESSTQQYDKSVAKLEEVRKENLSLQKDYASIGSDEFCEKIAREVFGYVYPEEKIFYESKN